MTDWILELSKVDLDAIDSNDAEHDLLYEAIEDAGRVVAARRDYLTGDLHPAYAVDATTDEDAFTAALEALATQFYDQYTSDTEFEWSRVVSRYVEWGPEERAAANNVFIDLTGYSLPSLSKLAQGVDEAEL